MPNTDIFSDLSQDDLIKIERLLENILINIDGIAGRKAILKNAGFAQYFIAGLDFNLNIYEFITILVSKFKDYRVSSQRLDYHPLIALLDYLLKQPERYNLENTDIKFARKIINIGKIKIQELKAEFKIQELKPEFKIEIPNETPTIDILIITALKDELNALKNCDNQSGKSWQELKDSSNYSYYKTTFNHKNGTQLNIVAARPVEMGENYTNNLATRLISELKPRCLAMTGVCAGNKKETFLGDVIVANRVFKFDYGKLVTHYESIGDKQIRTEEIFHDIRTYNLKRQWEFIIQEFPQDWLNTIQTPRPKSDYHQERWLLHKLYDFQQQPDKYSRPDQHPERPTECPDWRKVIQQLREKELLKTDSLELTEKAQKEINNERLEYLEYQHYKDPLNSQIHTGVIATTSKVQKDPQLSPRPKSDYHQERWLLHKLYDFQQQPDKYSRPDQHPERPTECPDWRKVIQQLREKELLKTDSLELTEKAQKEINNERLEYLEYQHYKDPLNSQIHTGVIATTSKVQKDPQLFQRIEKLQRKILGVEMEGAAIGAVAEIEEIPIIIVKGVQDYADYDKSDQFRQYAAEVSARFLLAFLTTIELAIFRKKG